MWTTMHRRRYDRSRLRYPSDLTEVEWTGVDALRFGRILRR
jgi:putative transposase